MTTPHTRPSLPALPCACASARRAARAITQVYDAALAGCGIRVTQFTILQVIARGGEMTQGTLGRVLALDSTTLSRTLKTIQDAGWIRIAAGRDRRQRRIALTAKGRATMAKATPAWNRIQERIRTAIGEPEWNELMGRLDRAAAAAQTA